MDIIMQTNRTILFEEINPQKLDLITLVGDVRNVESLSDSVIREINDHLLVRNFDEFLDKFSPVVYSYFSVGEQKVLYTLKKPENIPEDYITEVPLNRQNDFLNMLFTLIDTKRSQGLINVDFRFEKILDMISPKKVMEDIRQSRKEIHYLYEKHEELEDEDPTKLEIADKLNYKFEEASQNYNNVMAMLPLAIEDIKTRLLFSQTSEEKDAAPLQIGVLSMGEDGELKVLEAPKEEKNELIALNDNNMAGLIETFKEDYDAVNEEPSDYVRSLVVRTFCPLTAVTDDQIDVEAEVEKYNSYLEFYKQAKDDFVKTVKPLVEKILGVRMFFEQYTTKQKGMVPSLLITNTSLNFLMKSSNVSRLETYLNTVNMKNDYSNTVWLGIVPNVEIEGTAKMKLRRTRFRGSKDVQNQDGNSMESLTMLMNKIRPYKIQTFFSFQNTEETTFNYIATSGIDKFVDKCEVLMRQDYSEYISCCLPNFTIIPKEKSGVIIDNRMQVNDAGGALLSKEKEDILKLWIEGVYINSAYVAAGIVAAYQCPEFLKTCFKLVTPQYPGIRFDIEADSYSLKVPTTMAQEITGFTNTIKNAINSKGFGFIFASENSQLDGKDIKQITVYKARTLAENDNVYDSVYKTMVSTYVERILRFSTTDFRRDSVVKFFSNNPNSQKSKWLASKQYINSILSEGDDLSCTINDETNMCNINLVFNGNLKNLEVEITKETSAAIS